MSKRAKYIRSLTFGASLVVTGLMVSACGSQQYASIPTTQADSAPGSLQIKPKVDIVLVEEQKGRILDNYQTINQDARDFLSNLSQQNWNYHFATLGTNTVGAINAATSSTEDPNWGSQWTPAYPGEQMGCYGGESGCSAPNDDYLLPSIFETLTGYTGFLSKNQIANVSWEPTFYNLEQNFATSFSGTNFFRPDALLAVVVLSLGDDSSYVNTCYNGSYFWPCENQGAPTCADLTGSEPSGMEIALASGSQTQYNGYYWNNGAQQTRTGVQQCSSSQLSMNHFIGDIKSVASQAHFGQASGGLKIFTATANYNTASSGGYLCAGGAASPGTRYQTMATALGGQNYDVCSQPLSSILSNIAQNLTTTALQYEQVYIVLQTAPDPSSIQITKYIGGDHNNAVNVPQDPNNGWEYVGGPQTQYTIDYPIPLNRETGYMIKLNGSARLEGADSASVTYKVCSSSGVCSTVSQGQ